MKNLHKKINWITYPLISFIPFFLMRNIWYRKNIKELHHIIEKDGQIIELYNQWMKNRLLGLKIESYLTYWGYKKVAIYGMHYLGESLYYELRCSNIDVVFLIDKNPFINKYEKKCVKPDDNFEYVDAIIVTAVYYMDEIVDTLEKRVNCPILSLEDIVYEMVDMRSTLQ